MEILDLKFETCLTPIARNLLTSLASSASLAFHEMCIVCRMLLHINYQVAKP